MKKPANTRPHGVTTEKAIQRKDQRPSDVRHTATFGSTQSGMTKFMRETLANTHEDVKQSVLNNSSSSLFFKCDGSSPN